MVKTVPIFCPALLGNCALAHRISQWRSIDDKNVQQPIIVVVKQCDSWPHCFQQILSARMRRLILKIDSVCGSNVDKVSRMIYRSSAGRWLLLCEGSSKRKQCAQTRTSKESPPDSALRVNQIVFLIQFCGPWTMHTILKTPPASETLLRLLRAFCMMQIVPSTRYSAAASCHYCSAQSAQSNRPDSGKPRLPGSLGQMNSKRRGAHQVSGTCSHARAP